MSTQPEEDGVDRKPIASFSIQSTTFKKRRRKKQKRLLKPTAETSLSPIDDDNALDTALLHRGTKRRKLNEQSTTTFSTSAANKAVDAIHSYASNANPLPSGPEGQGAAVSVADIDTKPVSISDKMKRLPSRTADGKVRYRGRAMQKDTRSDPTKAVRKAPKFLGIGPQRAPDNVKITCRFDYQPDICKDWKETGFCGYGASCKFLHDRGDYKAGWQLERDWEKAQQQKMAKMRGDGVEEEEENWDISDEDDDDLDADGLPFACFICRDGFTDPVVTRCKHYFCMECAVQNYAKSDACAVCGAKTEGSFQTATKLIKKLEKVRKK